MPSATNTVGGNHDGTPSQRARKEWARAHTIVLLVLIVAVFAVGLIPPNRLIPGFGSPEHGLVVWLVIMGLLAACCVVIGRGTTGLWAGVLIDARNRMSLSRLQLSLWTVLVLSAFLAIAMSNIRKDPTADPLDIGVPAQVWGLLGISTTSFVTAATIKSQKKNLNATNEATEKTTEALRKVGDDPNKLADPQGALVAYQEPGDASVSDLFKGDEVISAAYLDLGKVQVFFFTLIVVFAYAAAVGALIYGARNVSALPELSTGMVALLGISHAGYLTAKAVPSNPAHYEHS